jgi:hypothetical protein
MVYPDNILVVDHDPKTVMERLRGFGLYAEAGKYERA